MAKRRLKTKKMSLKEAMEPSVKNDFPDIFTYEDEVKDYIDDLNKDDKYDKYNYFDDVAGCLKNTKNLVRIKETELKKEKTTTRVKKQGKSTDGVKATLIRLRKETKEEITALKQTVKELKEKNKELEIENQELKDDYSRFDILDFSDKK